MKFCTKCGAQLEDDATICMSCGCRVEMAAKSVEKKEEVKEDSNVEGSCPKVLFWINFLFCIACVVCGILSFLYRFVMGQSLIYLTTACGILSFVYRFVMDQSFIYLTTAKVASIISIFCFLPTIILIIVCKSNKWDKIVINGKVSQVKYTNFIVVSIIGLILALVTLII